MGCESVTMREGASGGAAARRIPPRGREEECRPLVSLESAIASATIHHSTWNPLRWMGQRSGSTTGE